MTIDTMTRSGWKVGPRVNISPAQIRYNPCELLEECRELGIKPPWYKKICLGNSENAQQNQGEGCPNKMRAKAYKFFKEM